MLLKRMKLLAGIIAGKPFTGPIDIDLELTDSCSAGCVMCNNWSPYSEEHGKEKRAAGYLDHGKYKKMLSDFRKMEVERINFTGAGEPVLYPGIIEIVEETRKAGFKTSITTNGIYLERKILKGLYDAGIEHMEFSVHAATAETYAKIHPALGWSVFERLKGTIKDLTEMKRAQGSRKPHVSVVYVVCNLNYAEIAEAVGMCAELGAEILYFKRLDVTEATKGLLLSQEQAEEMKRLFVLAKDAAKKQGIRIYSDSFGRCEMGGFTTGDYTSKYYERFPCYAGWTLAWVSLNGDMAPCCGSINHPIGNIYKSSLYDIWHSEKYREFRRKGMELYGRKNLENIAKCHSCNHLEKNYAIFKALHPLNIS